MTNEAREKAARNKPWMKWAFVVSLAVNLAVVGLVAGALLRDDGPRDRRAPGLGAYALPYMKALSGQDRRAVISAVRQGQPDRKERREERRRHYSDVLELVRADQLDAAALRDALAVQAGKATQAQALAQSAWLNIIENMSEAERMSYAQDVEDVLKQGPKSRK